MAGQLSPSGNDQTVTGSSSNKRLLIEDADRMNMLPQEILRQILSLVPTMDAAKVGLLSKILRTTWYSLSKFSFNYSQFPETENKPYAFFNFVDQTLANHDESDVETLEVWHWPFADCEIPIMSQWITFVVLHKVEKLILYGEIIEVMLPGCLFTCQSLVKLELAIPDYVLPSSETLALPNLRKLKLKFLVLAELTLGKNLFSNLPSLDKLSIFFCHLGPPRDICISSMTLEEFVICNCPGMDACSLELLTPCLSNFILISDVLVKGHIDVFPSVFKFIINGGNASVVTPSVHVMCPSLIKVTKELFKDTSLSLNEWLIEYLSMANDLPRKVNSIMFLNIMKLEAGIWPVADHIRVLILLASRCPNLIELSLSLEIPRIRDFELLSENSLVECGADRGFRKVSNVCIKNFGGESPEMMLVQFFLANMTELDRMRIVMNRFMVRNGGALKISEIRGYEKACPLADIIFEYNL